MKRFALSICFSLLLGVAPQRAVADDGASFLDSTSAVLSVQHVSKYVWRGFDLYPDDREGINPDIFVDLGGTGLYVGAWAIFSYDSANRPFNEVDYFIGFYNTVFEDERYALEYDVSYTYYDFPQLNRDSDEQEWGILLKLPNVLSFGDFRLVPYSGFYWGYPVKSNVGTPSALWWRFGMSASHPLPSLNLSPEASEDDEASEASIFVETFRNDGAGKFASEEGFSHVTFGASHTLLSWNSLQFTPSVYYQLSLEDTVNPENEFWFHLKLSLSIP